MEARPERRDDKYSRRRLATLQRRADFLESRSVGWGEGADRYDEAEFQALKWAIWALKQWINDDPYWKFDLRPGTIKEDKDGRWRELGHAYWNEWLEEWLIMPGKRKVRKATPEEIARARAEGETETERRSTDIDE